MLSRSWNLCKYFVHIVYNPNNEGGIMALFLCLQKYCVFRWLSGAGALMELEWILGDMPCEGMSGTWYILIDFPSHACCLGPGDGWRVKMARIRWDGRLKQNSTKFLTHLTLGVCDRNLYFWADGLSGVSQGCTLSLSCNIWIQPGVRIAVYPAMGIFHWSLFTTLVNILINNYWCLNCGGRHYCFGKDGDEYLCTLIE